ncbi:MAG: reverse transcriptase/maturase family protein [Planctomycetota bacterium]
MRRIGNLWPQVANFDALCHAARRAARGKRRSHAVASFLDRLEPECLALERALRDDRWRPGRTATFVLHDPKERRITVVPFADRVVHHALLGPLEAVFERQMIAHSFACQRDKGTHAALRCARRLVRGHEWFLKLDVAAFFASIPHDAVRATLARVIKDRRVLGLCDRILRGPCGHSRGRGLPIGSLTSQWWANLVLARLDRLVLQELRPGGYARYMDDFALLDGDRRRLRDAHRAIAAFLRDELGLRLKERATVLAPVREGLPWLGWRVYRGTVRVQRDNLRRARWRLRHRRWEYEQGRRDAASYRAAVAAVLAHLGHADTRGLRQGWFAAHALEL